MVGMQMAEYSKKPPWLRKHFPGTNEYLEMEAELALNRLNTICQEACCPNIGECFSRRNAAFLILGRSCTRNCRFCAVRHGAPEPVDSDEPYRLVSEIRQLKLRFAVITSVTRDDLPDGGAYHFADVINAIHEGCPDVGVEVLIPDFQGSSGSLKKVSDAKPEVLNHNVETVPRLYRYVRPQADYDRSVSVLRKAKELDPGLITKSGIMVGLGESRQEVFEVMGDLVKAGCEILTIGQYLCPSKQHYPVFEYVHPEVFEEYRKKAFEYGFVSVSAAPFVRSSYKAVDQYKIVRENRMK